MEQRGRWSGSSVSNGSRLPGFGLGWNQPKGPGPGQEPRNNPTGSFLAGLLPGPDRNLWFVGWVEPGPQLHITDPATFARITYLSSDRITL